MTRPTTQVLSDREFVLTHEFNAPAARIFAAYTQPDLVAQWWGNKGASLRVDRLEARPGGTWRFVQVGHDGKEMVFHGVYKTVEPVTRLVYTFNAPGAPAEIVATVALQETGGKTKLTLTNLCGSKEQRDAMVQYGAAAGARIAWERLEHAVSTPSGGGA